MRGLDATSPLLESGSIFDPLKLSLELSLSDKVNFINKTVFYSVIIISYFENRKLKLTPFGLMG